MPLGDRDDESLLLAHPLPLTVALDVPLLLTHGLGDELVDADMLSVPLNDPQVVALRDALGLAVEAPLRLPHPEPVRESDGEGEVEEVAHTVPLPVPPKG